METTTTAFDILSSAISFMTSNIATILDTVTQSEILCLGIAMWCIGGAISLFQRLV